MSVEGRGWATRVGIDLANWQQEEPTDFDGRRQLSRGGTSRVSREAQARICERLGVKLPGPTRRLCRQPNRAGNGRPDPIADDGLGVRLPSRPWIGPGADQREAALRPHIGAIDPSCQAAREVII